MPEATLRLQQSYDASLGRPISIQVAGRRYRLTMKKAKLAFDAPLSARRALRQPGANVPLAITWDRALVQKLSTRVAKAVYLAPRDATIRITLRHIFRKRSRDRPQPQRHHAAHAGRADAGQPRPGVVAHRPARRARS